MRNAFLQKKTETGFSILISAFLCLCPVLCYLIWFTSLSGARERMLFLFRLVSGCLSPHATSLQREPKVRSAKKKAKRRRPTLRTNTLIATIYSPLYPLSLFSCIARPQVLRRATAGGCFVLRSEVVYPLIQASTCSRNQMEHLISCIAITSCSEVIAQGDRHGLFCIQKLSILPSGDSIENRSHKNLFARHFAVFRLRISLMNAL